MPKIESIDAWFSRNNQTVLFVVALTLMCLCKSHVIRDVWPRPGRTSDLDAIMLVILIPFPALFGLAMRFVLKRPVNAIQISRPMAGQVNLLFAAALLMTYSAMLTLAEIAFG
jgi:hypothetical protein